MSHRFLPPATKLRQGNVFTPVCDSVHRGISVPACTTGHMFKGVSVWGDLCPGGSLFRKGDLCPDGSLSCGGLFPGVSVWGSLSRRSLSVGISVRETPWTETPGQRPPYSNERAVCILLECILMLKNIHRMSTQITDSQTIFAKCLSNRESYFLQLFTSHSFQTVENFRKCIENVRKHRKHLQWLFMKKSEFLNYT